MFVRCRANIATSFYSWREEVHEKITGVRGSFKKTVDGIKRIMELGLPLRVGMVAVGLNESETERTIQFLISFGVSRKNIRVDVVRPVGRGFDISGHASLEKTLCGRCWDGKLAVSANGDCFPCVFSRQVYVGNITKDKLTEVER